MLIELVLISILSVVQSVLGVGLLVFGTPTMILLGHSFQYTLSILLPSSLIISLLQYNLSKHHIEKERKMISFFSLPFLVIGLVIILRLENSLELKWILSFILTFSALLRMIPSLSKIFDRRIKKFEGLYLMVLGLVHGLTNLGGGLLTLYAASKGKEKIQMRGIISFGYLVFGIVQIIILLIFHSDLIHFKMILYPVSSGVIFYLVGNKVFKKIPEKLFTHLITLLIFLYGILLPLS